MKKSKIIIVLIISLVFCLSVLIILNLPKKEANDTIKYYNYEDLGFDSPNLPENTHLWWETNSSGTLYMVDSVDNKLIKKTTDKCESWITIKTNLYDISLGYYDITNSKLYYAYHDGSNIVIRYIDLSDDSDNAYASQASAINKYTDMWFDGSGDLWLLTKTTTDVYVWKYSAGWSSWNTTVTAVTFISGYVVVIGNEFYFTVDDLTPNIVKLYSFDTVGKTFTLEHAGIVSTSMPASRNLQALAYDGSDLIYYILVDDGDSKNYLIVYSISNDTLTKLGEYNVCLMLDRNTASGVMEKAFHLTEYKVYQLHPHAKYQLYYIAKIPATTVIVAITDNFLICDDVGTNEFPVYEYVDVSSEMTRVEFAHEITNYSEGTLGVKRPDIPIEKGMFMQIIGTLTSDELDRLFKGTYNFGALDVGTEGISIDWVTGVIGTLKPIIISNFDGHKKIMKGTNDGATNLIRTYNTFTAQDGTITVEWYMGTDDVTQWGGGFWFLNNGISHGAGNILFVVEFKASKIQVRRGDGVGGNTQTVLLDPVVNDTIYYIKTVVNMNTDQFTVTINETEYTTYNFFNDNTFANFNTITFYNQTDAVYSTYIDSINYSWEDSVGDNLVVEGGETDQVLFEGIVVDFDGERLQKVWLESPAKKELLNIKPRGSFSGRSDEIMTSLLSTYCKYITKGTFSVGTAMGTITYAGDKSLTTVLNELALFEKWIWKLDPQGRMFFNDGTTDTLVDLSSSDKLWMVKTGEVREPYNYFYLKGAIVSGVQLVKELEEADDLTSQQLHGYNPFEETYASFNSQTILDQLTVNVKARLKETPLVVEHWHYDADLGMIAHGETVTFVYNTNNVNVSSDQFLINRVLFKAIRNAGGYTIADKLV